MIINLNKNLIKRLFSFRIGAKALDKPTLEQEWYYENRIKKSLDLPVFNKPQVQRDVFGKIFIS